MFRTSTRPLLAGLALGLAATLLSPLAAGADPTISGSINGAPANGSTGELGQELSMAGAGCFNPTQGETAYMGEFTSMSGDPVVDAQNWQGFESAVDGAGSFAWDFTIPLDAGLGQFYVRWYCSTAPATSIDPLSAEKLWVSDLWSFQITDASAGKARVQVTEKGVTSSSGAVTISHDADGLPAIDRIGIQGPQAAALKARVDARTNVVGEAYRQYLAFTGKTPNAATTAFWAGRLDDRMSAKQLATVLSLSDIPRLLMSDAAFVDDIYRDVLGRKPTVTERREGLANLKAHMTRANMVLSLADSTENVQRTASEVYVTTAAIVLGASLRPADVNRFEARLDSGDVRVSVVEDIALTTRKYHRS